MILSPIATIGTFLVSKFGKNFALTALVVSNRVILFTLLSAFVGTMLSFLNTLYNIIMTTIEKLQSLANGTFDGSGGSSCINVLMSATLNNLGVIDAWNTVAPTIFLAIFTFLSAVLFALSYKIHKAVNEAIRDFAMAVK